MRSAARLIVLLLGAAATLAALIPAAAQGPLAPDGLPGQTYLAPFPLTITLDGNLSDWAGVPRVTVPPDADLTTGVPAITFAAAADATYLYFMADVIDSNIISGAHGTEYWNEDSVEFYVNATGNLTLREYVDGVAQITIPALNIGRAPEEAVIGGMRGLTANALATAATTPTGYVVEAAVPLHNDVWDITVAHGAVIGFQVHLNGASRADRDTKLIWSVFDTADRSYLDPSLFGQLIFFEIGQTAIPPTPTPIPTATPIPLPSGALYRDSTASIDDRVEDLLARMTLAEKIGQMTLVEKNSIRRADITALGIGGLLSGGGGYPDRFNNTPEAWAEMVNSFQAEALRSRLGVPLIYGVDAVHGHNNVRGTVIFPHNIGLGAADDPALMEEIGRVTALEMIATGIYWNYAPVVAVPQDIRWGRTYEAYSENTELVTRLAVAYLRGLQGDDLADPATVLATPKHYVGDGGTAWGSSTTGEYMLDQGVTDIDEATLRAVHLPPYIAAIEAGAQSIMISFSSWGGLKMHAQRYLITDVLKGELGFSGFVVSDWGGIDQISPDYYAAVVTAINAGIDMNMVPYDYRRFIDTLTAAVENGDVPLARIDDAVRRILRVKFALGLFEHPFGDDALLAQVGSAEHRAIARAAVTRSLVLLRNEGNVLPLDPATPVIFVGGQAADDIGIQSGGWTIEWQGAVGEITEGTTILEGIEAAVDGATQVFYDRFGRFNNAGGVTPDACIAVVGEQPYAEGIGDRANLALAEPDIALLARMRGLCAKLIVIVISGRPLILTDQLEDMDALVAAWLPGSEGQGVADALFGLQPFTGRLPFTWPRSMDQVPLSRLSAGEEPLFPRGFGLQTGE
ncbi:MAG: hypothetical protein HPY64_02690 [Anaerolineae bacterium]|nr:hypothetical protein [Anaerolineae bacterium]